jgi:hypothetical protein
VVVLEYANLGGDPTPQLRLEHCSCGEYSAYLWKKERADERTRTADLISLRVCGHALQGCAGDCKSRIFRGVSFPCLAAWCTVLRSRWYQSGVSTFD